MNTYLISYFFTEKDGSQGCGNLKKDYKVFTRKNLEHIEHELSLQYSNVIIFAITKIPF